MAKFVEYNAPIEGLKPTERGSAAYETLGRTQSRYGHEAGAAIAEAGRAIGEGIASVGKAYEDVRKRKEETDTLNELSDFSNTANAMTVRHTQEYFTWLNDPNQDHSPEAYAQFSKGQHDEWQGAVDQLKTKGAKQHAIGIAASNTMTQAKSYNTDMININVNNTLRAEETGFKTSEQMLEKPVNGGAGGTPGIFASEAAKRESDHQARLDALSSMSPEARNAWDKEFKTRMERFAIVGVRKFFQQYKPDDPNPEKTMQEAKDYLLSSASPYRKYLSETGILHMDEEMKSAIADRKRIKDSSYQEEVRAADTAWKSHINDLITKSWAKQPDGSFRQNITPDILEAHRKWMEDNAPDKILPNGQPGALKHAPIEQVQKTWNDFVEVANHPNEHMQDNGPTVSNLLSGLTTGETTMESIIQARHDGKLSDKTYQQMIQEFDALKGSLGTPQFKTVEEAIKNSIVSRNIGQTPVSDAKGWGLYAAAMQEFIPKYRKLLAEGKVNPGDLDTSNPNSMLSTFLREGHYVRTWAERIKDITDSGELGQNAQPGAAPAGGPPAPAAPRGPVVFPNAPANSSPPVPAPAQGDRFGALGTREWPHGMTGPAGVALAATDQTQRVANVAGYGDQLTGTVTVNGHTYRFVNGGGGRGSIPFGEYRVGNFRDAATRAGLGMKNLGDTFDLSNVKDDLLGGATRSALRIHMALHGGTAGCIGIVGGPEVFKAFVQDMQASKIHTLKLGPVRTPAETGPQVPRSE